MATRSDPAQTPTRSRAGGAAAAAERAFTARVVRPVFQYADVEVRAASDAEAAALAARGAAKLPRGAWREDGAMNRATAARDVIRVVDHAWAASDLAGGGTGGAGPAGTAEAVLGILDGALRARRYALLTADVDEVEGGAVFPRWVARLGEDLELADLAADWVDAVGRLERAGARGFWRRVDAEARRAGAAPPAADDPRWVFFPRRPEDGGAA